jgi:hypothetical protein
MKSRTHGKIFRADAAIGGKLEPERDMLKGISFLSHRGSGLATEISGQHVTAGFARADAPDEFRFEQRREDVGGAQISAGVSPA